MKNLEILRKDSDFQRLYKKGKKTGDQNILVFYIPNEFEYNRRAFLASKKVGNSVERNRARRLMKESWRLLAPEINQIGSDVLFVARLSILKTKQNEVQASMRKALIKAKFIN